MKLGGLGCVKGAFELRSRCVVGWGHLTHDICDLGLEGQRTKSHVIAEFIIPNKTRWPIAVVQKGLRAVRG